MYRIVIQPNAAKDLQAAYDYIFERAPGAAMKWYSRIRARIATLRVLPGRCPVAPESEDFQIDLRQLRFGRRPGTYRIFFEIHEVVREVHVLAIRHTARRPMVLEDIV